MKIIEVGGVPVKFDVCGIIDPNMVEKYQRMGYKFHISQGKGIISLPIDENNEYQYEIDHGLKCSSEKLVLETLTCTTNTKQAWVVHQHQKSRSAMPNEVETTVAFKTWTDHNSRIVIIDKSGQVEIYEFEISRHSGISIRKVEELWLPLNQDRKAVKEALKAYIFKKYIEPTGKTTKDFWEYRRQGKYSKITRLEAMVDTLMKMYKELCENTRTTYTFAADGMDAYPVELPRYMRKEETVEWICEGKRWWKCPNGHSVRAASNATKIICEFCKSEKVF